MIGLIAAGLPALGAKDLEAALGSSRDVIGPYHASLANKETMMEANLLSGLQVRVGVDGAESVAAHIEQLSR